MRNIVLESTARVVNYSYQAVVTPNNDQIRVRYDVQNRGPVSQVYLADCLLRLEVVEEYFLEEAVSGVEDGVSLQGGELSKGRRQGFVVVFVERLSCGREGGSRKGEPGYHFVFVSLLEK